MNEDFFKNPTVLIIGGVALVAGFILLKGQGSAPSTTTAAQTTSQSTTPTSSSPLGAYETYLDGSGAAHQEATGPYYINYATGQVPSGAMSGSNLMNGSMPIQLQTQPYISWDPSGQPNKPVSVAYTT